MDIIFLRVVYAKYESEILIYFFTKLTNKVSVVETRIFVCEISEEFKCIHRK